MRYLVALSLALSLSAQINDGAKYSPLGAIDRSNAGKLAVAWTFHTGDIYRGEKGGLRGKQAAFETTPLFADNTLFITTPFGRVIALEPETGKQKWTFDPKADIQAGWGDFANRGVTTWVDPTWVDPTSVDPTSVDPTSADPTSVDPTSVGLTSVDMKSVSASRKRRLFIATIDARLIALDAATGQPIPSFAKEGSIDLRQGLRIPPRTKSEYEETSVPAVIGDVIVVGSAIADSGRTDMASGEVRAYDVRSGKLLWTFDPLAGTRTGAGNAWSGITPDPAHGLVFVPTGSPSPDYYGGERKGNNQYANAVVALEAKTGKVKWFFQTVHHDLWDYDVASQPALVMVKGKPAVAVGSKTGNLFLLDRLTGKPVFGVEERAVPKSDVPGELASATQPFPKMPLHLGASTVEVWGPTPEEKRWCEDAMGKFRNDGIFTPPSLQGSVVFPGNIGGMAWGGVGFDPKSATLFVPYNRLAAVVRLVPRADLDKARKEHSDWETAEQTGTPYGMQRTFLIGPKGAPCSPPPYGMLAAIDANTGQLKWEVPTGYVPWRPGQPEWGSPSLGGPLVTAGGLLFLGATFDPYLKAYDVSNGKEVWRGKLPTSARATPMTFQAANGKQYVVIAAGGHDVPGNEAGDSLVAFAIP